MSGTTTDPDAGVANNAPTTPKRRGTIKPRWKKGESGNPSGKSKALEEVRTLARQHGREAVECIVKLMRASKSPRVRLAAAQELLNRGFGRPPLELSGPGGSPLVVGVVPGEPIRDAISAAAAYAALIGNPALDPASIVFDQPAAQALPKPELFEAKPIHPEPAIAAPAPPARAALPVIVEQEFPAAADSGTRLATWQRLSK